MKVNLLSDLHLEFSNLEHRIPKETDVLILAGDIGVGLEGLEWATQFDIPVVYIAGNHEFYKGHVLSEHYKDMLAYAKSHEINFLQNDSVIIDGVRFIGATLWTDFKFMDSPLFSMMRAKNYMYDYRQIFSKDSGYRTKKITPEDILEEFETSIEYIESELKNEFDGSTVIITHHGVSKHSISPKFKFSNGNEFFVSDLEQFISKYQPNLWLHGHTHCCLDYTLGDTRVVTNPRGYVTSNRVENPNFNPNLLLEV